jgi:hypothetical protein
MPTQEQVAAYAAKMGISVEEAAKRLFGHIAKVRKEKGPAEAERVAEGISKSLSHNEIINLEDTIETYEVKI